MLKKKKNFMKITQEGLDSINKELSKLLDIDRPKAVKILARARDMGDLSENSAYTSAREQLNFIDNRINELQQLSKEAKIVEKTIGNTVVGLGSAVEVEVNGKKQKYLIVSNVESDISHGKMSDTSPIGKALLGKKVGDMVEVKIPAGIVNYTIVAIM